jgi:nicotinamidase-related amidase
MATVRPGNRPALVIVDVQMGVVAEAWESARVIGNVALAVDRARAANVPVIWVQHADEELPRDSDAWQWVPELVPGQGEARVHKRYNSAFEETSLEDELARSSATHVVLAGAATNWCVRATAYGALDRGYDVTLVMDAHTTSDIEFPDGRRIQARDLVDDLNVAMRWLSYPGRANRTAKAGSLDFATPVEVAS